MKYENSESFKRPLMVADLYKLLRYVEANIKLKNEQY